MGEAVYIVGHQGLGDHLVCNGLYREYASTHTLCILGVTKRYEATVLRMVSDLSNVRLAVYPDKYFYAYSVAHSKLLKEKAGFAVLQLGYFGIDFFTDPNLRLDANFYFQANLDLSLRWNNFKYERDINKEQELFDFFDCSSSKYIFLHEDKTRNYQIMRDRLPSDVRIIEPNIELRNFNFFDYRMIIENSFEIHCIESSFSAFIEMLDLSIPKFAHRYARPEAKNDFCHEYTYKSAWQIVL